MKNFYFNITKLVKDKPDYILEEGAKKFDSISFVLLMLAVMSEKGIRTIDVSSIEKEISTCCSGEDYRLLTENLYEIEPGHFDLSVGMCKQRLFQKAYESEKNPLIKIDMDDEIVDAVLTDQRYEEELPIMRRAVTNYKNEFVGIPKIKSFLAKK